MAILSAIGAYLVLTLCGLILRSTHMTISSASVSSDLKALYKSVIIIIIIIFNPRKTRVGKKLKKLKRMERLMFRAVVQLKTIVQQNRIETK